MSTVKFYITIFYQKSNLLSRFNVTIFYQKSNLQSQECGVVSEFSICNPSTVQI